jgi:hypothetical protein
MEEIGAICQSSEGGADERAEGTLRETPGGVYYIRDAYKRAKVPFAE